MSGSGEATGARGGLARLAADLQRARKALSRIRPRRSIGAVQNPVTATPELTSVLGWAYVPHDRIESVVVAVNGEPAALARLGLPAPDVAAARRRPEAAETGWEADVDLTKYAGNQVVLSAVATTSSGVAEHLTAKMVRVGLHPAETMVVGVRPAVSPDVLVVAGFTASQVAPATVDVIVDGKMAGRARILAEPTPHLTASRCPHANVAGFVHVVERPSAGEDPVTRVEASVRLIDGTERRLGPVASRHGAVPAPPVDVAVLQARAQQRASELPQPASRLPALRLLIVTHALTLGGGQLYLSELLGALVEEPDIACVLVAPRDGPLRRELEGLGITVHISGEYPVLDPTAYESKLADLIGLARYHGSNVVVVNTMGCSLGADLAQRVGLPVVWAVHESFPPLLYWAEAYGPEGYHPYIRQRGLEAIGAATALVFECEATRRLFEPYVERDRLVTLPYGIGLDAIDRYRRSSTVASRSVASDGDVQFLVVGTFEGRKGQARVATAFAQLAEEYPRARLTMVGLGDDPYSSGVQDLVRRLGLEDRIELLPVTSDLYPWYSSADALVSASDIESLPRSVLEGMAFDMPVLATAVFGLPEIISDGVNGLLVEPRDVGALITGLRRFLELDPAERVALGRAGGERVRAAFARSEWARPWSSLLRHLADGPGSASRSAP